jgi:hypothetical protein
MDKRKQRYGTKTIDDKLFSDVESCRDEWNRLKPFFEEIMKSNDVCWDYNKC